MVKALQKDQETTDTKLKEILNAIHQNQVNEKELIQSMDHQHEHAAFLQTLKDDLVHAKEKPLIPSPLQRLFSGMARVSRDDFFQQYDTGVPQDETIAGNENVLLLYSNRNALPPNHDGTGIPLLSVENATQHCNTLKIVMTQPDKQNECLALVGQWESYHVQKFMRLPNDGVKGSSSVSESNPLRHVSRLHIDTGLAQRIPTAPKVRDYNRQLVTYLSSFDAVLKKLMPIAARAAKDNTIVVMVCNHGQSELLMNFVCSSRARGLDLSQVLVFATDEETRDLAEGLGLVAFYSHVNFESMPKHAAGYYADDTFTEMMMAKLYSVHLISQLGYDLLFQDVDVMWYRNPLPFFSNFSHFDVIVQDDGARNIRFQPYSPNSGFYFARHNERTEYFIHSLLMAGPIILQSGSHQNAMAAILNEHSSWRGLHVKTWNRNMQELPNGYHFQTRKEYMKDIIQGNSHPIIFHMSWTSNKEEKRAKLEQMGDWYVKDMCVGSTAAKIRNIRKSKKIDIGGTCCKANPKVKCHYKDKPSRIPCKESPALEKNHPSFW
eukprot:CAMPEP_0202493314 /NCGR_PEP_ID=MMETSP1361-20130828/9691_1 /ASSEMBLY_ACC=CAM_ASM_000849 /TAXON_ID=210615 /ORGANISM="Staurosira complex sp., Strain CCMP2646" /LENGTH=548 /DNA_ID=CAMNT_0049123609 /DNA_START=153 /DNA_END=1799 /DNA_ORIENTATION=+